MGGKYVAPVSCLFLGLALLALGIYRCVSLASASPAPQPAPTIALSSSPEVPASPAPKDLLSCLKQLDSPDPSEQGVAIQQIKQIATTDPYSIAKSFNKLGPALMRHQAYPAVEECALQTILQQPYDVWAVSVAQRARFEALFAEGKYDQALVEAKSFYNQTTLTMQGRASEFVYKSLLKVRGEAVANQFKAEQDFAAPMTMPTTQPGKGPELLDTPPIKNDGRSVLSTIKVDSSPYLPALQAQDLDDTDPFDHSIARGNLFLLGDQFGDPALSFRGGAIVGDSLRCSAAGNEIDDFQVRRDSGVAHN